MTLLTAIAAFLVTLGVLVVVHSMATTGLPSSGVKVLRFSIGFGRPLARWVRGQIALNGLSQRCHSAATCACSMSAIRTVCRYQRPTCRALSIVSRCGSELRSCSQAPWPICCSRSRSTGS